MRLFVGQSFFVSYLFFLFCTLGTTYCSYAQTYDAPQRIEFEVEQGKYPYHLRLLGENGIVLLLKGGTKDDDNWTIIHYDTNFALLLKKDIHLDQPLIVSAINSDRENFYFLLQSPALGKVDVVNTYIVNYNILSKKIDVFSFYHPDKSMMNHIALLGDIVVFTTYNAKSEEHIYVFDSKNLTTKQLYTHKTVPCQFQHTYLDTATNSLWIVTKFFESKKQTLFTLTQLNPQGKELFEKDIMLDDNYYLNSCRMTRIDSNQLMLIGDYALNTKESIFTTRNNNTGIFVVSIVHNEIQQVSYQEYGNLEGHFGTVNKKNMSDLYSNTYITAQSDSIIIVASDFYTPEYVHEVYQDNRAMNYGIWVGSPYMSTEAKLVGFKYHTGCFFILNKTGKVLWYNTFNYNGLMLKTVKDLMNIYIDPESHHTLYYFGVEGRLYSLVNKRNEIIQPLSRENIDPASRFLSVNANLSSQCEHWYQAYFIYYGYQRLNNRYSAGASKKNTRYVFYINKLAYK
jgi:hypothetical protein